MVYNDPDAFFMELLMEENEPIICERIKEQYALCTLLEADRDHTGKISGTAALLQTVPNMEDGSRKPAGNETDQEQWNATWEQKG